MVLKQYFYQVRGGSTEWMRAWLTSDGCISIVSDYGNFGYWFGAPGGEFRRFLTQCDDHYLGTKFSDGHREYKGEETLRRVKERILSHRREGDLSREEARTEWDLLDQFDRLEHEQHFTRWYDQTELSDASEFYCTGISSQIEWFLKRLWPFFVKALEVELAAEAAIVVEHPLEMGT